MLRYKAIVEVVTKHSVIVHALSEEEAYEELDTNGDLYTEDNAVDCSWTVVDVESDGI